MRRHLMFVVIAMSLLLSAVPALAQQDTSLLAGYGYPDARIRHALKRSAPDDPIAPIRRIDRSTSDPVCRNRWGCVMTYGVGYLVALVTFVAIDMAWLSVMAPRFYKPTLGDIAISGVNLPPAIAFYLLYPVGLLIFAIVPALKAGSMGNALIYGALFGFFTYATYDLTNQATLRNWTTQLTLVDVAWGSLLGAVASAVTFWVVTKFVAAN